MAWSREIVTQYGSMTNFLMKNRLASWGPPPYAYISAVPFRDASDYTILINDWPYGLAPGITHVVVWSKTPIATEQSGDVTESHRGIIEDFVAKTFVQRLNNEKDRVMWFKNWTALQSVRALEHIHVLVRDVDRADLEYWTGKSV